MPVSPDYASGLSKAMLDLYAEAEERILIMIAARLARGIDEPGWLDRQLIEVQQLLAEVRAYVDKLATRSSVVLEDTIRTAWNRGAALAGTDLRAAGVARSIAFGGVNQRAVAALLDTAHANLAPLGLRIQSQAPSIYRSIVQQVSGQMLSGSMTRRQATAAAVQAWTDRGITGFVDSRGRSWTLTSYAEMTTRTAATQAIIQGHVEQLGDAGFDLVMISKAPESCDLCGPFEGKILSAKGRTPLGFQTVDGTRFRVTDTLANATSDGLFHPQCRHRTTIYLPGITRPLDDAPRDREGAAQREKQRAYERRLRELKRRVEVLKEIDPKGPKIAQERAKLKAKNDEFAKWLAATDRPRKRERESVRFTR